MNTKTRRVGRVSGGFTLVELMVVIAIIAMLAAVVGVNVLGAIGEGNHTATVAQIRVLKDAVVLYKTRHRTLPDSLEDVVPYLDGDTLPTDAWGNAFIYSVEGSSRYTITSYGGDGSPGGEGEDADIDSNNLGESN